MKGLAWETTSNYVLPCDTEAADNGGKFYINQLTSAQLQEASAAIDDGRLRLVRTGDAGNSRSGKFLLTLPVRESIRPCF